MFVNGPGSCDEQTANLFVERLSRRPCTYVIYLVSIPSLLKNSHVSFLVCCGYVDKFWEWIKL